MDLSLILKIAFWFLPAGAAMIIASRTVRQGGNVKFYEIWKNGVILFVAGIGVIFIVSLDRSLLQSSGSGFEFASGAGESFVILGAIEFCRYLVFGKRKGTESLAKAGCYTSLLGALLVIVWLIGRFGFGL